MRYLGLDVGDRRIGLATGDPGGMIATPRGAIERTRPRQDIARIIEYARANQAEGFVVGMPLSLNGEAGTQAKKVRSFLRALRRETDLPVETVDERYSTAEAERLLRGAGRQPSRHRGEVDAAAAAVILQEYMDRLRAENAPGDGSQRTGTML